MTTISDSNVVDWIATSSQDEIVLAIADGLDWEQELEHLFLLQEKLNCYLRFVESGEAIEQAEAIFGRKYPKNVSIEIRVFFRCAMPLGAQPFFNYAQATFKEAGLLLTSTTGSDA